MTRDVVIAGTAIEPFSKESSLTADLLGASAVRRLAQSTDIDLATAEEVYVGSAKGGGLIGQRALRFTGLASGLPVFNVENACASSGVAFHLAHRAILAGAIESALVIGVDKLSSLGAGALPVQKTEWDGQSGVTNPVVYAMRAQRYIHETGATPEDLAEVTVKSRRFASRNPVAHMRKPVTVRDVLDSRLIADPLTLFQCSPKSDGATAALLLSSDLAKKVGSKGPRVRSSVVTSGKFMMSERDITRPDITARAAGAAYEQAGMGPDDLDVVELHDAFSIAELLYTEELGLVSEGEAVDYLRSGRSSSLERGGGAVVNPSGGLLGRGHPIGATGLAQIVECANQLSGQAGDRQREVARIALAHVTGGGASGFDNGACAVTILSAD
jgi:acetyl-CoA acetyltransferase